VARLVPATIAPSCPSPGEHWLFTLLRESDDTSGWFVLHSLGIARHQTRLSGEIDFLVLIPAEGVLCLEVKGGAVARREGVWFYGREPRETRSTVGPFRQAADGMHALRRYLAQRDPSLGKLLFASAVVFSAHDFHEASPEWESWQVLDRSRLERSRIGALLRSVMNAARSRTKNTPSTAWYSDDSSRPTEAQIARIVNEVRADFEIPVSPRMLLTESERAVARYTEEQFAALDVLTENDRVLFKGPAGTGKTFLAIEAAVRAASTGKRTLLCCYNRALGHHLADVTAEKPASLTVSTLHGLLRQLNDEPIPNVVGPDYWSTILPTLVVEKMLQGRIAAPLFDYLVIDEAQDLLRSAFVDFLDLALVGGLANGSWAMFGDLERQSLYAASPGECVDLASRSNHFVFPLRTNCRNTAPISAAVELLANLHPPYSRVLNRTAGEDPQYHFYRDADEQRALLAGAVNSLLRTFRPDEVVILSMRDDAACCAASTTGVKPHSLLPLRDRSRTPAVRYASIHAFKGLEAPAVIVTDIYKLTGDESQALLYVALTRARFKLIALLPSTMRVHWLNALAQSISTPGGRT
jgi:hypothetical protein